MITATLEIAIFRFDDFNSIVAVNGLPSIYLMTCSQLALFNEINQDHGFFFFKSRRVDLFFFFSHG